MVNTSNFDRRYSTTRMAKKISSTERELKNEFFSNNKIADGGLRKLGIYKNSVLDKPLLTIIIAVFNGEKYLEETILSVLNQTYDNVEFIIIDGGSTDGSLGIIRKYEHAIDYWISEEDAGISDAFNKGVRLASGDYINFQGDGDGFYDSSSLAKIVVDINVEEDMFISARIQRVSEAGDELYISSFSPQFNKKSLLFRMSMPHQGLFTNVEYFKKYGLFDVDNTYCMDYEHLLRAYHDFPSVIMKNVVVAKWRADGLGNDRDLDIFKEYHKIKVDNKVASLTVLRCINFWTLFKYIIKKAIK
ncbi:glycosyltransferase family 2 protein [Aliivibrio fischeri]|uniref:glycosyltransferase family 2 protein n=1 Tax=Aliivibrio fischeri TaxID=668 RepID=UPI0018C5DC5D|nr:glycosyltransferase family 2 protein [Aliivibrio fischeri]